MPTPMVNAVLIDSRNGSRLVSFYRDLLSLPLAEERHGSALHWGCFLGGLHFAIHEEKGAPQASAVAISFAVDDVDEMIRKLRAAGVLIAQEPADRPFGRLAAVRDPDGNLVYLHKYPPKAGR